MHAALPRSGGGAVAPCPGLWPTLALLAAVCVPLSGAAAEPRVALTLVGGERAGGRLRALTATEVVIDDGTERRLPVEGVRRLDIVRDDGATAAAPAGSARVWFTDGGWIRGDDFAWRADKDRAGDRVVAALVRGGREWQLPADRVLRVAWDAAAPAADPPEPPSWQADLPEDADGDLLVVSGSGEPTFVPCAIQTVSAEAVTVVVDGETIPVKRAKVIGLALFRPAPEAAGPPAGAIAVVVRGGRLLARRAEWSADGLVVDGSLTVPEEDLVAVDYAVGRTVDVATLTPDRVAVEPFFGNLAALEGLGPFFAPRALADGALLVRPRSELEYRIPTGGRRFRATAVPAIARAVQGGVAVVVRTDDREVFRGVVSAADSATAALPIDVDLTGARRMVILVEFTSPADQGFPLRLESAVIDR